MIPWKAISEERTSSFAMFNDLIIQTLPRHLAMLGYHGHAEDLALMLPHKSIHLAKIASHNHALCYQHILRRSKLHLAT